jgi:hypothetical protein
LTSIAKNIYTKIDKFEKYEDVMLDMSINNAAMLDNQDDDLNQKTQMFLNELKKFDNNNDKI